MFSCLVLLDINLQEIKQLYVTNINLIFKLELNFGCLLRPCNGSVIILVRRKEVRMIIALLDQLVYLVPARIMKIKNKNQSNEQAVFWKMFVTMESNNIIKKA